MLCVLETQICKARVESLCRTLGFDHCFAVGSRGCSGGLGVFWRNKIQMDILLYSQYHNDLNLYVSMVKLKLTKGIRPRSLGHVKVCKILFRFALVMRW